MSRGTLRQHRDQGRRPSGRSIRKHLTVPGSVSQRAHDSVNSGLSRLAAELHDRVAQSLWSLDLELDSLGPIILADPNRAREKLTVIRRHVCESYEDVRLAIGALRMRLPIHSTLSTAISRYVADFARRTGIDVRLVKEVSIPSLSKVVELQLLAILQQALSNVERHAEATSVLIAFTTEEGGWELTVEDDGHGFRPNSSTDSDACPRFGLSIMEERARSFQGTLRVSSTNGAGVTVAVFIPRSSAALSPRRAKSRTNRGGSRGRQATDRRRPHPRP